MASKLFFVVIIIVFPTACYLFSVYIRVHELAWNDALLNCKAGLILLQSGEIHLPNAIVSLILAFNFHWTILDNRYYSHLFRNMWALFWNFGYDTASYFGAGVWVIYYLP